MAVIAGAFPPVMFDVTVDGVPYDEMHVDGGVISEATALSGWQAEIIGSLRPRDATDVRMSIYIVRNGRIAPEHQEVKRSIISIGGRAVSTLIKMQGLGDLLVGYDTARARGADYHVTWIGEDLKHDCPAPFDQGYMGALFDYGYQLMKNGEAWSNLPPQVMTRAQREAALRMSAPRSRGGGTARPQ